MKHPTSRGIFIVDEDQSPLWRVAQSHALNRDIEIICASDFFSTNQMAKKISSIGGDFVIFSWRGAFDAIFSSRRARLKLLNSEMSMYLLIPDLIGIHRITENEKMRVMMADGLLVTSKELYEKYQSTYKVKNVQILHDYPPIRELEAIRQEEFLRDPLQIVWVGNSKWGERAGFVDHKGLATFATPLIKEIQRIRPDVSFIAIDSAVEKIPYSRVLRAIRKSACLIFTSNSEGTGLPIIEAAALETPVVTLNVGIAPELFKNCFASFVSPKEIPRFTKKVLEILADIENHSKLILEESNRYRREIASDFDNLRLGFHHNGAWRNNRTPQNFTQWLKWKYRWLRYFLKSFSTN